MTPSVLAVTDIENPAKIRISYPRKIPLTGRCLHSQVCNMLPSSSCLPALLCSEAVTGSRGRNSVHSNMTAGGVSGATISLRAWHGGPQWVRERAGMVDAELKVYGTNNKRVVDKSILTAQASEKVVSLYEVAERASHVTMEVVA